MDKKIKYGIAFCVVGVIIYLMFFNKDTRIVEDMINTRVSDLLIIKDRIRNIEKYRSEDNTGLTVAGTVLEQGVDIIIAVLKQDLITEVISKTIKNKEDADEIAEYIELLGVEIVNEIKNIPILKCAKPRRMECKDVSYEKPVFNITGRDGEEEVVTFKTVIREECEYIEDENAEEKTSDCDNYVFNQDIMKTLVPDAMKKLLNKVASIVKDPVEREKIYRIAKNLLVDNNKQISISRGIESEIDDFPSKTEFDGYLNEAIAEIDQNISILKA